MKYQLTQSAYRSLARLGRLTLAVAAVVLLLGVESCNEPLDRSSYSGNPGGYAQVSVKVDSRSESRSVRSSSRLLKSFGASPPNGTALVIAVVDGTPFSISYNSVSGYYDKQLVDLTTSTVTLTLPMNTSIQLFQYVFAESWSLAGLESSNRRVFSHAVLGPLTLTSSTSDVELVANLEYALDAPFDDLVANGSYNIEYEEYDGISYYMYEAINWQTLSGTFYIFNPTSREFEVGESPRKAYELINNQWIETSGHSPSGTFDSLDRANRTAYYTNPDFSATLVGLIDLAATGFGDRDDGKDDDAYDEDGDGDDELMAAEDFTPGAVGYIFEINGSVDADYRLEEVATSHDCMNTEFSTLDDYISYHTSTEFYCEGYEGGTCLRFQQTAAGDTSGNLVEIVRDYDHNIINQDDTAGTWEISTVQNKEMLFIYPDNSDYYYDGTWMSFWSVNNGKVWEGHYAANGAPTEPMYIPTFNAAAINDYRRFLEVLPPEGFIADDYDDGSCGSQNWDQVTWDNFYWAP